jgi:hypothetical protein
MEARGASLTFDRQPDSRRPSFFRRAERRFKQLNGRSYPQADGTTKSIGSKRLVAAGRAVLALHDAKHPFGFVVPPRTRLGATADGMDPNLCRYGPAPQSQAPLGPANSCTRSTMKPDMRMRWPDNPKSMGGVPALPQYGFYPHLIQIRRSGINCRWCSSPEDLSRADRRSSPASSWATQSDAG